MNHLTHSLSGDNNLIPFQFWCEETMPKLYQKHPSNLPKITNQLSLFLQSPKYFILTHEKFNGGRQ